MNCLALLSQERSSAKFRQVSRDMLSARMQALRRSVSKAPTGWSAITSSGPVTGNAATGVPHASASSWTTPKVSVRLGKTNTSAARGQIPPGFLAQKSDLRILVLQRRLLRSFPDHDLGTGQVQREKRLQIFFDRYPADGHENRPGQIEFDSIVGLEEIRVDAPRPGAK